jgi:hypothetical protein
MVWIRGRASLEVSAAELEVLAEQALDALREGSA